MVKGIKSAVEDFRWAWYGEGAESGMLEPFLFISKDESRVWTEIYDKRGFKGLRIVIEDKADLCHWAEENGYSGVVNEKNAREWARAYMGE